MFNIMLFDLHFRYDDEDIVRPYVINCDLSKVSNYSKIVANLSCVSQIFINIHPSHPSCEFHEYTV